MPAVGRGKHATVVLTLECDRDLIRIERIRVNRVKIEFRNAFRGLDEGIAAICRMKDCERTGTEETALAEFPGRKRSERPASAWLPPMPICQVAPPSVVRLTPPPSIATKILSAVSGIDSDIFDYQDRPRSIMQRSPGNT